MVASRVVQAVFEGIGIVLNRQATAGAPAPAPLPPPEMTQSPENALLNSANLALASGPAAGSATPSFATEPSTGTAVPTFMGDGLAGAPAAPAGDGGGASSSSWLGGWFGKKSESG